MPTFGKKGKPSTGRRKLVETWPPEWKPLEECPQVMFGMIDPDYYDLDLEQFDPLDEARIFLQKLRDSRGYDLEDSGPLRVICPLRVLPPRSWKLDIRYMNKLEFVTNQINAQAKKHNEEYELVELVNFVYSLPNNCDFFTFNFRQVSPKEDDVVVKTVQAMVRYELFPHGVEV